MARASSLAESITRSRTRCVLVILLLTSLLTIPPIFGFWMKPVSGLAHSEGQRVQPALEMLAHGAPWSSRESLDAWLVPHLFDQAYLRKPPGMVWAIAASQAVFGEKSLFHFSPTVAARLVSALATIVGALITFTFASRWLGRTPGLIAGCAWSLFPIWYWYPPTALSAEIESLNNLFVLSTSLALFDILLWSWRRKPSEQTASALSHIILTLSFAAMLLTKGPAGIPTLLAVLIACTWARAQHISPLTPSRRDWLTVALALFVGALVFGAWLLAARCVLSRTGETPVTQEFTQFLFTPKKLFGIISLPVAALISALPHAVFFTVFLRPSQRLRPSINPLVHQRTTLARTIALSVIIGVIISMMLGVSNPRYTLPTLSLIPACVGGACWWLLELAHQAQTPQISTTLRKNLRTTLSILTGVVLIACVFSGWYAEHRRTVRTTGETDGARMGAAIVDHVLADVPIDRRWSPTNNIKHDVRYAQLWGDEMLDIRPEIVMATEREAEKHGVVILPKWKPLSLAPTPSLPTAGNFVLLRTDTRGRIEDLPAYKRAGLMTRLRPVFKGTAHDFEYTLYVVTNQ